MSDDPELSTKIHNILKEHLKIIVRPISCDVHSSFKDGAILSANITHEICLVLDGNEISRTEISIEV